VFVPVPLRALVLFAVAHATAASAQSVSAGMTAGLARFSAAQSEQTLTAIVQAHPRSWLTLSVIPSLVRVSDSGVAHSGLGDLPLVAAADHQFPGAWSPVIGAALSATLPTGNASCGLGSGSVGFGLDGGVAVAPAERWQLSAGASHSLGGVGVQSTLSAPHATALRLESAYAVADRWTASLGFGADVGSSDSTQALSRVLGGGVSYRFAGDLALTVDATRGLTNASPHWVLSVGFGTAFVGASPVNPTSTLRRLRTGFVGGVKRTRTAAKAGTTSC
jgi:hypothetical protein